MKHKKKYFEDKKAFSKERDIENRKLCERILQGDKLAENLLIINNRGIVEKRAWELYNTYNIRKNRIGAVDLFDLEQEGRLALLSAVHSFDFDADTMFSTYAYRIIENAIHDICRKAINSFDGKMVSDGYHITYLDADSEDTDGLIPAEKISGSLTSDPTFTTALHEITLEKLYQELAKLPERESMLILYLYSQNGAKTSMIAATANYFHLAEKSVIKIEQSALRKLRARMSTGII